MTAKDALEYALIECNKLGAPALLEEDYNYLFNKAIQQYINLVYNRCEYNQQSTDDLSFLQVIKKENISTVSQDRVTVNLPENYLHMLGCKATFNLLSGSNRCSTAKSFFKTTACSRLTADLDSGILGNYYLKPSIKKPYFYIHGTDNTQTEGNSHYKMDILAGSETSNLVEIEYTYLKTPEYITIDFENTENAADLPFPDYVCYEIINCFVRLLLENASDPRLQTNMAVNQSIAIPGQ